MQLLWNGEKKQKQQLCKPSFLGVLFICRWESQFKFVDHLSKRGATMALFLAGEVRRGYVLYDLPERRNAPPPEQENR